MKEIDTRNGFTFIRLLAATLVLVTHTYVVLGIEGGDLLERNGYIGLSKIGVDSFFTVSGYLVTLSLLRNGSIFQFALNRSLRIFPGLAVAVFVSVFLVGPVVSVDADYIKSPQAWSYLRNIFPFCLQPYLPGVFVGQEISVVNGSLWTLPLELLCYVALAILAWAGVVQLRFITLLVVSMLYLHLHDTFMRDASFLGVSQLFLNELGYLFFSGALLALTKNKLPLHWGLTVLLVLFIGGGFVFDGGDWHNSAFVYLLFWPYVLISAGLLLKRFYFFNGFDVSYGVYIYGFVVQQCMVFFFPALKDPVLFMLISIGLSFGAGWLSWVCVERPFLRLKNTNRNSLWRVFSRFCSKGGRVSD